MRSPGERRPLARALSQPNPSWQRRDLQVDVDLGTLLARCRRGDELAWEALVRAHQGRIYAMAYHYVANAEEARDLTQDIFVRVYQKLDSCTEAGHFVPWTIRIARNACIDHLRRRKARPPGQDLPVDEVLGLAASDPNPEEAWMASSRQRLVHLALRSLSELSREIILLKDIQGLSFEEIATLLDVPVGTVKSRSSRARVELARKILALSGGRVPGTDDVAPEPGTRRQRAAGDAARREETER